MAKQGSLFDTSDPSDTEQLAKLRANMRALLNKVGDRQVCKGPACGAVVWFARHKDGRIGIYNPDGSSHFSDCPDADKFRG